MLALDWKKAFDSLNLSSLLDALRRLGLPWAFVSVIECMMGGRTFVVNDSSSVSNRREQRSGISQGCTLSPLLFICVMTVMMHDAVAILDGPALEAYRKGELADLTFADDTLLLSTSSAHLQKFLSAVSISGQRYGLELHYGKFQLLGVNTLEATETPVGGTVEPEQQICYLGTTLGSDGRASGEIARRIGMARGDFRVLSKV